MVTTIVTMKMLGRLFVDDNDDGDKLMIKMNVTVSVKVTVTN